MLCATWAVLFFVTMYVATPSGARTPPVLPAAVRQQSDLSANVAELEALYKDDGSGSGSDDADDLMIPSLSSVPRPGDDLVFYVVGDWGNGGARRQAKVARSMAQWALHRPPSFIVSTGDNMYDTGVSSVHDKQFKKTFENVYTDDSIKNIPWWMSLGNHDHGYHEIVRDVMAQVNYSALSPRWRMPAPYYRTGLLHNNLLEIFVLDTYERGSKNLMGPRQVAWLEESLSTSSAPWKVVVGHRPIYSCGAIHGSSKFLQQKVLPVMVKHRATVYLAGDDHTLQVLKQGPTHILVSGAGSRTNPHVVKTKQLVFKAIGTLGFMIVTISNATDGTAEVVNASSNAMLWMEPLKN